MKRRFIIPLALATAVSAAVPVSAQVDLWGSDTLYDMTHTLVNTGTCGNINYLGLGSSTGEKHMTGALTPITEIAPMSRALKVTHPNGQQQCLAHSLDAISIVRKEGNMDPTHPCESTTCDMDMTNIDLTEGDGECPGCSGTTYQFGDFKDVLALAYGGLHHDGTVDCDSSVRHYLANHWEEFFIEDAGQACADENCDIHEHIYRRGDLSGTTDTLMATSTSLCRERVSSYSPTILNGPSGMRTSERLTSTP